MEQTPPAIGRIADRHSSQTGSREMLTRGTPQRRQSEGNRVANRLSAITLTRETNELGLATSLVPVARVGYLLLLKTSLPRSGRCYGGSNPTNSPQYSGQSSRSAIGRIFRQRHGGVVQALAPEPPRIWFGNTCGSSRHSVPASKAAPAGRIFPAASWGGSGTRPNCHSLDIETA